MTEMLSTACKLQVTIAIQSSRLKIVSDCLLIVNTVASTCVPQLCIQAISGSGACTSYIYVVIIQY